MSEVIELSGAYATIVDGCVRLEPRGDRGMPVVTQGDLAHLLIVLLQQDSEGLVARQTIRDLYALANSAERREQA